MIDISVLLQAVISLAAVIITVYVIPWIKAKTGNEKYEKLCSYARVAAQAAEQLYGLGHGDEKLAYAISYLETKGITVDRAVIEAKVRELFNNGSNEEAK